jgi:hypothetical protein
MKILLRMMLVCFFISQLNLICLAQDGIITNYAGPGLPLNGAMAITQGIEGASQVALDGVGGFYIASAFLSRVYRVSTDGKLHLIAGSATAGYGGDGGPATSAQILYPTGIVVDSAGNLLIADYGNSRIRKVTPDGIITTVAGNGNRGYGGDGGPATSAQLKKPKWSRCGFGR